MKRTNSQSAVTNGYSHSSTRRSSVRSIGKDNVASSTQLFDNNDVLLKKSTKLIEFSKNKRTISPDKLKSMRQIFNTIGNFQPSKMIEPFAANKYLDLVSIERLADAFIALEHDTRKDILYQDFLTEHQLNGTSGLLDFEHFALLVLEYEEKLRLEDEALHRLDLKIAFEYFDINKDGMIDVNELLTIMNTLQLPITAEEAKNMIDFADHDKDHLLSFDEFLTVLTQISTMNMSSTD
ncbi:unnamed protein product [Adineta ricciae]|uniref:EF-hand domain-containing protein n=1 Tax=Adineta ricciae TaxID=249248 RepID=A0A813Q5M9_ADIRI|nr:unnamed protein product [Adineta ricciae]